MAVDGFPVLDADGHVVEPAHVFGPWIEAGRMPIELAPGTPMVMCGDNALVADQLEHGFDGPSYLRAMDAQGIDAAVVYPSIGLFVPFLPTLDDAASTAACRSYNDWVSAWCSAEPARLAAAALVPLADPVSAAAEAERAAEELGLVAVVARPNHLYGRNLGDPEYDPLWATCARLGLVVAVHEGLGLLGSPTIGSDRFAGFAARHALSHPMEQMAAMASLVLDGALERHLRLRVAFLESGSGWLPYWLHRLDEHREWLEPDRPSASSLFERAAAISSEAEDRCIGLAIDAVGAERVMWASDFPHPDAVYPGAPAAFLANCEEVGVTEADARTVLWDAPRGLYSRLSTRLSSDFGGLRGS